MRPIDLQDNLSKAPLAGREQQIQQASSDLGQRQVAQELAQQHVVDHSRTRAADPRDGPANRVDHRVADDQGGRRRRRAGKRPAPSGASQTRAAPPPRLPSPTSQQIDLVA